MELDTLGYAQAIDSVSNSSSSMSSLSEYEKDMLMVLKDSRIVVNLITATAFFVLLLVFCGFLIYSILLRGRKSFFTSLFLAMVMFHCIVRIVGFSSNAIYSTLNGALLVNFEVSIIIVYGALVIQLSAQMIGGIFLIYAFLFLTRHWFLHSIRLKYKITSGRWLDYSSHSLAIITFLLYLLIVLVFVILEVIFSVLWDISMTFDMMLLALILVYGTYWGFELVIVLLDFAVGFLVLLVGLNLSRRLKKHHKMGIRDHETRIAMDQLDLSQALHKHILLVAAISVFVFFIRGIITAASIPADLGMVFFGEHCDVTFGGSSRWCWESTDFVLYATTYLPMYVIIYYIMEILPIALTAYILFKEPSLRLEELVPLDRIVEYAKLLGVQVTPVVPNME